MRETLGWDRFRLRMALVAPALLVGALAMGGYAASAEEVEPSESTATETEPTTETSEDPNPEPEPEPEPQPEPEPEPEPSDSSTPSDSPTPTEEPKAEEPSAEEPSAEEPAAEEPAAEEPPMAEDPAFTQETPLETAVRSALSIIPALSGNVVTSAVDISVAKVNDADGTTEPGDDVTFTVTVTNSGDAPITISSITDSIDGGAEFAVCDGGTGNDITGTSLDPGENAVCTFTLAGYAPPLGVTKENTVRVEANTATPSGKFLIADEDTIDNASDYYLNGAPGVGTLATWDAGDVNDGALTDPADASPNPARRTPLDFFADPLNIGTTITIQSGDASDPGFFAIDNPPRTTTNLADCAGTGLWGDLDGDADPDDGIENFLGDPGAAFPHGVVNKLGTGGDPEKCLDKVPGNALDANAEIEALVGQQICVLTKDSDVSFDAALNPDLLNLQGGYLGVAAFEVTAVLDPDDPNFPDAWGDNQLPGLVITILDPLEVCGSQEVIGEAQSFVTLALPTGQLDVVKAVAGSGEPVPGTTFTVHVNCDGTDFDETLEFDEDGNLTSGTSPITGIPLDTQCTVTETDEGGANAVTYDPNGGSPGDAPTVTVTTEGQTVTVTVTNTFNERDRDDDSDDSDEGDEGDEGDDSDDSDDSDEGDEGDDSDEGDDLPSAGGGPLGLLQAGMAFVMFGSGLLYATRRIHGDVLEEPIEATVDDVVEEEPHVSPFPGPSSGSPRRLNGWAWPIVVGSAVLLLAWRRRAK